VQTAADFAMIRTRRTKAQADQPSADLVTFQAGLVSGVSKPMASHELPVRPATIVAACGRSRQG
jgi:hypothetical protein